MVFSKRLRKLAAEFRQQYLSSTDVADGTVRPADWRRLRAAEGSAIGGPYLAAHLRRLDFLRAHPDATPSIGSAASQLIRLSRSLGLSTVFLATDDPEAESQLTEQLLKAAGCRHPACSIRQLRRGRALTDGELAILDQIVGSHAAILLAAARPPSPTARRGALAVGFALVKYRCVLQRRRGRLRAGHLLGAAVRAEVHPDCENSREEL
ncbi:hypothetical protein BOX15_Mlig023470g2 [Macrostomum lignano]|uniref:GDP-fucose protein O-fucosyltransferase 2 n=1 Tax=Macrostomum lignano TaxID=282301 RepID=A0A267DBD0_9PLAT|nr:hypothetical protein BOX15_Mlig023470g2 [Macrostomum lignano]